MIGERPSGYFDRIASAIPIDSWPSSSNVSDCFPELTASEFFSAFHLPCNSVCHDLRIEWFQVVFVDGAGVRRLFITTLGKSCQVQDELPEDFTEHFGIHDRLGIVPGDPSRAIDRPQLKVETYLWSLSLHVDQRTDPCGSPFILLSAAKQTCEDSIYPILMPFMFHDISVLVGIAEYFDAVVNGMSDGLSDPGIDSWSEFLHALFRVIRAINQHCVREISHQILISILLGKLIEESQYDVEVMTFRPLRKCSRKKCEETRSHGSLLFERGTPL
jgi:hypothetical protein